MSYKETEQAAKAASIEGLREIAPYLRTGAAFLLFCCDPSRGVEWAVEHADKFLGMLAADLGTHDQFRDSS